MLWALALLGLVPAAFMLNEDVASDTDSDADTDSTQNAAQNAETENAPDTEVTDLLDDPSDEDPADGEGTDSDPAPDTYEVDMGSGETVFDNFDTGMDHITLNLTDGGAGEFIIEPYSEIGDTSGVSLSYDDGAAETTLSFPGLDDLPEGDISVRMIDPETGEETMYALSELGDFGAITPNDPDVPDLPGPTGDDGDVIVAPNDDDTPDVPGPTGDPDDAPLDPDTIDDTQTGALTGETVTYDLGDLGETFVLPDDVMQGGTDATLTTDENGQPTIETAGTLNIVNGGLGNDTIAAGDDAAIIDGGDGDDTIYGGDGTAILSGGAGHDTIYAGNDTGSDYVLSGDEGADTLIGGAGDDSLLIDAEDTATGGAGADAFWLYFDAAADVGHAEITDFETGEGMLRVTLNPEDGFSGNLTTELRLTGDGASTEVVVNGAVVALLEGNTDVTMDDIVVERLPTG